VAAMDAAGNGQEAPKTTFGISCYGTWEEKDEDCRRCHVAGYCQEYQLDLKKGGRDGR